MIKPSPPQWALNAGLPAPKPRESFGAYTKRLGIEDDLLEGLNERTMTNANTRLASYLMRMFPTHWLAYRRRRYLASHGHAPSG